CLRSRSHFGALSLSMLLSIDCTSCPQPPLTSFLPHLPPPNHIAPLSLHDALPIWRASTRRLSTGGSSWRAAWPRRPRAARHEEPDRKSTRLNSSHQIISYAVFCLKKKQALRSGHDKQRSK